MKMNTKRKRMRFGKHHDVEVKLLEWIDKATGMLYYTKIGLSLQMILTKASEIAKEMGRSFAPGKGWFSRFAARHCLKRVRLHGEGLDVDLESFSKEIQDIQLSLSKFEASHIFNMDEAGLFFRLAFFFKKKNFFLLFIHDFLCQLSSKLVIHAQMSS
jgi:hypothetical protein